MTSVSYEAGTAYPSRARGVTSVSW